MQKLILLLQAALAPKLRLSNWMLIAVFRRTDISFYVLQKVPEWKLEIY
jgi:hypothetical protein